MAVSQPPEVMVMIASALIEPYHLQVDLYLQIGQAEIIPRICLAGDENINPDLLPSGSILSMVFLTVSKGFLSVVTTALQSRFTGIAFIAFDALHLIHPLHSLPSLIWTPDQVTQIYFHRFKDTSPIHVNPNLYPNLKKLTI